MKIVSLAPLMALSTVVAEEAPGQPWESPAAAIETGFLWHLGTNSPLSYRLVPTQISWRSSEVFGAGFEGGSRLLLRHRFNLLAAWIEQGPESYYLAGAASPSVEWWNGAGTCALYSGAGGGVGLTDSRGVEGGQGQDSTLHWFVRGGIEHLISPDASLMAGVIFLHMSNGGQTDPNPSINALGFTIGYARRF